MWYRLNVIEHLRLLGGICMIVVNIDDNRTLTLPKSCSAFLKKGKNFMFFQSDNEIILKRINDPDIKRRALRPSKYPIMTMDEISEIVREDRRKNREKK